MMNIDRTSCVVKVWVSFVQKLLGISRWQQSIKPGMGPGTPRKLVLSLDRLNVARVLIECGPDSEILARALGPLGTSQMKQLRPSPPQRHLPTDAPPSRHCKTYSLVTSGWRLHTLLCPPAPGEGQSILSSQ